ncbi:YD repeat-containing protein [Micromonospora phaseoli]|uniref:YD repeat-containing protein n=1 Tax=Micromonospora phaseoli TaxID=1144548 RepID=A0A1H7C9U7_9ACTN|nr:hypothetical protein [Micromonospora phaseoli]PZV92750.1 YD repeat-containing protein [Micromonospora phaseoli]GIJ76595.1 hypothetical protein Xph01_10270 [Micromonospora phaseoli]SEJ82425.1 YD repeat-containing protein [Micromonospora phaseoli]
MSQVATITYGSGNVRSLSCGGLQRLKTETLKNGAGTTTLGSINYGYDDNGNETSKVVTGFAGGSSNTYTYDLADRLTSWNDGTTNVAYAYDDSGNRTQVGARTFSWWPGRGGTDGDRHRRQDIGPGRVAVGVKRARAGMAGAPGGQLARRIRAHAAMRSVTQPSIGPRS